MALHSKWSSGHLIFYDGTTNIMEIKNSTDGVDFPQGISTTGDLGISGGITVAETATFSSGVTFSGNITYPDPDTTALSTAGETTGTLTSTSNRIQFFTGSTTARNVIVAQATGMAGIEFKIFSSSSTGVITVKEAVASGTIVTLAANKGAIIVSDGTNWRGMVGSSS